jgi:glycogen debranching enzyme
MAIAALARISQWHQDGAFTSRQYLAGAERAFAHLQVNNLKYDDDGKENIIDDYCALMAATELWLATGKPVYRDAARLRAAHLEGRMSPAGYFISNDADRPFWHAADAGLPVVALARYLDAEKDDAARTAALTTIRQALDYYLRGNHFYFAARSGTDFLSRTKMNPAGGGRAKTPGSPRSPPPPSWVDAWFIPPPNRLESSRS